MHESAFSSDELAPLFAAHLRVMGERLEEALAACELDGVCVFAGPEKMVARDDIAYPFKIEPYFKAWLPLTRAVGSVLMLTPGRKPQLIYRQADDFWHEPPADPEGFWCDHFDVQVATSDTEVARYIARHLSGNLPRNAEGRSPQHAGRPSVENGARFAAIGDPGEAANLFASVNHRSLVRRLDFFRAYKTDYEVACLERASAIAVRGHRAVAAAFADGATEFELHQCYCSESGQRETELPYNAIVALDRHAAILHYQNLDRSPPAHGASFLIDAGAQFNGYASDITRTTTRHPGEFRDLLGSMEALQQTLCRELQAGVDFRMLHERAHELLAGVLCEHALVTCSADEALAQGLTRTFLPHGLGHLLGLQVHDAGGRQISPDGEQRSPPPEHPFLRLTRVVEAGFVVTIEPGIYFIPSLLRTMATPNRRRVDWNTIERLLPYGGIRVEDDVLVEAHGIRNLTREAFAVGDLSAA